MPGEARKAAGPFAPLWARVMLAAGWAVVCLRASAATSDAFEVLRGALAVAASVAVGAIVALGEPRPTRRSVAAYALAWLLPALASYAVPLDRPPYPPELRRTIVSQVLGVVCLGGVTAARGAPGLTGAGAIGGELLRGAGLTLAGWCLFGSLAACAAWIPAELAGVDRALDEVVGALVVTGSAMAALDLARWLARGRPADGTWLARLAGRCAHGA